VASEGADRKMGDKMDRLNINLKTAANHGYRFAIIASATWLGLGSNVTYIVTKHRTEEAARRELKKLSRHQGDFRIVATTDVA